MPQLVETSEGLARVEGELSMRGNKSVATAIVYPAQAPIVALDVLRCIPNGSVALDPTINLWRYGLATGEGKARDSAWHFTATYAAIVATATCRSSGLAAFCRWTFPSVIRRRRECDACYTSVIEGMPPALNRDAGFPLILLLFLRPFQSKKVKTGKPFPFLLITQEAFCGGLVILFCEIRAFHFA